VRDGLGEELQDDRIADLVRRLCGLCLVLSNQSLDRGNTVGSEELFGFGFGEEGPTGFARALNDSLCLSAIGRDSAGVLQERGGFVEAP
jgi:hypothetical protein